MVKAKKTSKTAAKRPKRGLSSLRQSEAQRRRQEADEADEAAIGADKLTPRPLSAFGLVYSARLRDAARSGGRDARLTLRLHPDLRDLLILCSQKEHRTLSQMTELILMEFASGVAGRLTKDDLKLLGWDDAKIRSLETDPHPFARELHTRLKRGF